MKSARIGVFTLALASCLLIAGRAADTSGSPSFQEVLNSDQTLRAAESDVLQMNRDELVAFKAFLAACVDDLSSVELIQHECNVARESYEIEFSADRPLDQEIRTLHVTDLMLRALEAGHAKVNAAALIRANHVEDALGRVATLRFLILRKPH